MAIFLSLPMYVCVLCVNIRVCVCKRDRGTYIQEIEIYFKDLTQGTLGT